MADDKKTAALAGAGITAAVLAAFWASQKAEAAPPGGVVSLDEAAMQALISILQRSENLDADSDKLITIANRIAAALGAPTTLQNPPDITAFTVFTTALVAPIQLPYREIPYNMELVVKALHINTGVILVAPSRATAMNTNGSYWLIANEAIEYRIRNADHIWISCHPVLGFVGDGVVCTVEQEASH